MAQRVLQDAEKAYQCPAGKYCCGNGLPSDGSKDWQKCCVSPLQGGIKLELWPTVGVCLVVMVMLAGGENL